MCSARHRVDRGLRWAASRYQGVLGSTTPAAPRCPPGCWRSHPRPGVADHPPCQERARAHPARYSWSARRSRPAPGGHRDRSPGRLHRLFLSPDRPAVLARCPALPGHRTRRCPVHRPSRVPPERSVHPRRSLSDRRDWLVRQGCLARRSWPVHLGCLARQGCLVRRSWSVHLGCLVRQGCLARRSWPDRLGCLARQGCLVRRSWSVRRGCLVHLGCLVRRSWSVHLGCLARQDCLVHRSWPVHQGCLARQSCLARRSWPVHLGFRMLRWRSGRLGHRMCPARRVRGSSRGCLAQGSRRGSRSRLTGQVRQCREIRARSTSPGYRVRQECCRQGRPVRSKRGFRGRSCQDHLTRVGFPEHCECRVRVHRPSPDRRSRSDSAA
ncbi:hypothetical protein SAMN04488564_112197 [Lentzea waywayandensis]|uniref:Uncharacterized protein n=1 Tax=Lentzea waywayandensis TaxID=84724 RepID=A0A1I6FDP0_9PSEU|nr:hypothetical protein SAMN04488564_112197 [Lentzea waywayandensis]